MKPTKRDIIAFVLGVALAALASAFAEKAMAQSSSSPCITSADGFVDGVPCFSFDGRLYSTGPGKGVEVQAIVGPIPGIPLYFASPTRFGHTIVLDMGAGSHPADGTLVVLKIPDRVDGDAAEAIAVRTDTSEGDVRQHSRAVINRGGGAVAWGSLTGGHWHLFARTPDGWVLLD